MKKVFLLLISSVYSTISFSQLQFDYSILRTDFVKGTYKVFSIEIKNDSVQTIRHSTNGELPECLFRSYLNKYQRNKLYEIFKECICWDLKDSYINNNVEGEGQSVYEFKFNSFVKKITVYYIEVPCLKKLDTFFCEIIPANFIR